MRIDAYTHFIPAKFFNKLLEIGPPGIGKRVREVPSIHDLDIRKKVVDQFEDYAQILSYPQPPVEILAKPEETGDFCKIINDGLAEITEKHATHFPGTPTTPFSKVRAL